ncbi:MAG TPA: YihY/virulence factor BrkB family protein [Pyrinomonadaceae bacterium]|nr:YihY/virulence factor BrkB family protein [Pyrinomonadaceae bacterium]
MENLRRPFPFFSRGRWGVKNHAPWMTVIQQTFHQFHENDLFTPAAAMSYFGLLTLFPALLVLLVVGNRFAAGSEALTRIVEIYPGSREFLRATIKSLKDVGWGGLVSAAVVTLWAGSWVFAVIERALNRIWGTRPRTFLHGRALTLGMIGAVGVLLIVSVFLTSIIVGLQDLISQLPLGVVNRSAWMAFVGNAFWQTLFAITGALVTIALFAVVYRLVPSGRVTLRDTLPSAILAGLLWETGKYLFASSLQYFHYDEIYGSVGAVVAVLTWSYVSSLILMFGAQLSVVLHQEHVAEEIAAETPASPS